MRYLAALVVTFGLSLGVSVDAEATRSVPGFKYHDVCKNVEGKQSIVKVMQGRYSFKVRKNGKVVKGVCVRGWNG